MCNEQFFEGESGEKLLKSAHQIAHRFKVNPEDHDDAVQQAMMRLWKSRHAWTPNGPAKFHTFAYACLKYGIKSFIYLNYMDRKDAPFKTAGIKATGPYPEGDAWQPTTEDDLTGIDLDMRMERLTPKQRTVVEKLRHGLSIPDVARSEGKTDYSSTYEVAKRAARAMRLDGSYPISD